MISIVVCTYNRDKYLSGTLKTLANQRAAKENFEIILVNNNSTDNTHQIGTQFEKEHPELNFRYFIESNQGLSYARNRGITESKGDCIAFVDDDADVDENYVSVALQYLNENTKVDAIGGKILLKFESERPKWSNKYLDPLWAALDLGNQSKRFEKGKHPIGCNMVFRSSVFDAVGQFNTELGRTGKNMAGSEEKDLFMRMYETGMRVDYVPEAFVHHNIPDERTTIAFIKKQALGVGLSERIRNKNAGTFSKSLFAEFIKWGGTFCIAFIYLFGHYKKSIMLIRFRYWVTKGLFGKSTF